MSRGVEPKPQTLIACAVSCVAGATARAGGGSAWRKQPQFPRFPIPEWQASSESCFLVDEPSKDHFRFAECYDQHRMYIYIYIRIIYSFTSGTQERSQNILICSLWRLLPLSRPVQSLAHFEALGHVYPKGILFVVHAHTTIGAYVE